MAEKRNLDQDDYARDSYSMRGMAGWQRWGITAVVVILIVAFLYYLL
jgi:hypothetical protein